MSTKQKPEHVFSSTLAKAYPGMSSEMRRGIVGIAIRSFLTEGGIIRAADTAWRNNRQPLTPDLGQDIDPDAPNYDPGISRRRAPVRSEYDREEDEREWQEERGK